MQLTEQQRLAPPQVLVVDDDPTQVDLLARFLSRKGMIALPAYNGQECMERVNQDKIDLILLDIMMPEMNGLEVCTILKQHPSSQAIPIIVLTAKDDAKTRFEGIRLGVSEFLIKPARGKDLLACIRAQLEASRRGREGE